VPVTISLGSVAVVTVVETTCGADIRKVDDAL